MVAFCEEIDTTRIEIYFDTDSESDEVFYWDAGGCSESTISNTGIPFSVREREFVLAANIGKISAHTCKIH